MTRRTKTYLRRMAHVAELTLMTHSPGDGVTRYRLFDARAKANDFHDGGALLRSSDPAEVVGFISGFISGRNREICK